MKLNCIICNQAMFVIVGPLAKQFLCQRTRFLDENYHYLTIHYEQNAPRVISLSYRISADQIVHLAFEMKNQITQFFISKDGAEESSEFKINYSLKPDFLESAEKSAEELKNLKRLVLKYVNLSIFS